MIIQIEPKEVTKVITQVGVNITPNEDSTTTIRYSLNDVDGNGIINGTKIVPSTEMSFLFSETIDMTNFENIFKDEAIKVVILEKETVSPPIVEETSTTIEN